MTDLDRRRMIFSAASASAAFGLAGPLEFIGSANAQKAAGSGSGSDAAVKPVQAFKRFKVGDIVFRRCPMPICRWIN